MVPASTGTTSISHRLTPTLFFLFFLHKFSLFLSLSRAHIHIYTHNSEKVRFYGLKFQLRLGDRMDLKKTSSGYAWRRTRRRGKSFDLFYRKAFNPLPILPPIKMTHFSPLVPLHLFSFSPPIALFS